MSNAWYGLPVKRVRLRPFSAKRLDAIAAERDLRQAWLRYRPRCEVPVAAPHYGETHIHEAWTRARGGPTDDPRNFVTACNFHNDWLSQSAGGIAFGKKRGWLVSAAQGPAWLADGGRMPGLSRDEAIALVLGRKHNMGYGPWRTLDDLAREQGLTGPPPDYVELATAIWPTEADAEEFRAALAQPAAQEDAT